MKKNTLRYLLVIIIVILTAIILQFTKVVNIVPKAFWISSSQRSEMQERQSQFISTDDIPDIYDTYIVFYDGEAHYKSNTYYHLTQIFRNAHIEYDSYDAQSADITAVLAAIDEHDHIVFTNEVSNLFSDENIKTLEKLVESGTFLSVMLRSFDFRLEGLAGFSDLTGFIETLGINFKKPLFPGIDEVRANPKAFPSSSLDLTVDEDCEMLLESDERTPLLWKHPYGKGSVLYANTTLFQDKTNRGIYLQFLLDHSSYGISTVFNKKIFNIDDFPAPLPLGLNAKIFTEYHRDIIKFFKDVWWSDIRDLGAKYDLTFAGLVIGTYNNDTTPPFKKLDDKDLDNIKYFARKLDEVGGELGIHGYNHNSLLTEGLIDFEDYNYNPWASKEDMTAALDYLESEMEELVGEVTYRTYVPPSNMANRLSEEAILEAFPDLKVFAGLYTGSKGEKETLIQEFGANPYFPGVYDFPRFSSGYTYKKKMMWYIYNAIAEIGVFHHFIHPDDVLDPERSAGMPWSDLLEDLNQMLDETFKRFPYLEPVTPYVATLDYMDYENIKMFTRQDDSVITIWLQDAPRPTHAYLRVDHPIIDTDGVTLHSLNRDGLYFVTITKPIATIELLHVKE